MPRELLPQHEYYAGLPRKIIAAGALVLNSANELLLLETTYKPDWEIPGGIIEAGESPRQACRREVQEELGLALACAQLLCVDYSPAHNGRPEGVKFIFAGGQLSDEQLTAITLDPEEIKGARFVSLAFAKKQTLPALWRRVAASMAAFADGQTRYLEDGQE